MATAKPAKRGILSILLKLIIFLVIVGFAVSFAFGEAIAGFGQAGTGYAAKTSCSCRYVAGRDLDSCYEDFMPGMWAIWLSEDEANQSVTATIPAIESNTASYEEGYGCVLEEYEG